MGCIRRTCQQGGRRDHQARWSLAGGRAGQRGSANGQAPPAARLGRDRARSGTAGARAPAPGAGRRARWPGRSLWPSWSRSGGRRGPGWRRRCSAGDVDG